MKKIICLLICIFTIICCFGCSPSNTVRLKYKIEGSSICFMTPNGESLYSFFGIDKSDIYSTSTTSITFCENSEGKLTGLGCSIRGYNLENSYFIIKTVFDDFSETLINNVLEKSKFIYVCFQQELPPDNYSSQAWAEISNRIIFDNQPLKLIKV